MRLLGMAEFLPKRPPPFGTETLYWRPPPAAVAEDEYYEQLEDEEEREALRKREERNLQIRKEREELAR